jgi:small subunit ribosomal protein S3
LGQKCHPYGFRVGITKDWRSRWYATKQDFGKYLVEDQRIRRMISKLLCGVDTRRGRGTNAGVAGVEIERTKNEVRVLIHTARPGVVIGRKGSAIDELRAKVEALVAPKKVEINIKEISSPEREAQLVAMSVGEQIARRSNYRRAVKRLIETSMNAGVLGIRIRVAGRLGGSELARIYTAGEGKLPLQTLDADIDYGFVEAPTQYGHIGIKCWIFRGMIQKEGKIHGSDAQTR